jgi:hypothetical protein
MSPTVALPDGALSSESKQDQRKTGSATSSAMRKRVARGRWLLAVLSDRLGLPRGKKPDWVLEVVDQLSGRDTPLGRRFPCPCCDFLTLEEAPTGTFQICPVCRWEDDNVQYADLDYWGGANKVSLSEARENFRRLGTSDQRRLASARPPLLEEHPDRRAVATRLRLGAHTFQTPP